MLGFMYKDAKASLKSWLWILLLDIAIFATLFLTVLSERDGDGDTQFLVIIMFLCFYLVFLLISVFSQESVTQDERYVWKCFAMSTPGTMKAQIIVKYLMLFLSNLVTALICVISFFVFSSVYEGLDQSILFVFIALISWNMLKESISLPFAYAFGTSYGNSVKNIMVALGVSALLIYGLFGDISFFFEKDFLTGLVKLFTHIKGVVMGIFAVVLCLYILSCAISMKVYRRWIENR